MQDQARGADRARLIGAPGQVPPATSPPATASAAMLWMSVSVTCPARARILAATTSRGCQASLFDPEPLEVAA